MPQIKAGISEKTTIFLGNIFVASYTEILAENKMKPFFVDI